MKPSDNFNEVIRLLRVGGDVTDEEISDAWGYASDAYNETYRLAKSLKEGYRAQQETIKRKDALLEAKIREIEGMKRTIWILNQKLRAAEGKGGGDK